MALESKQPTPDLNKVKETVATVKNAASEVNGESDHNVSSRFEGLCFILGESRTTTGVDY